MLELPRGELRMVNGTMVRVVSGQKGRKFEGRDEPWLGSSGRKAECRHLGAATDIDHACGGCGGGLRTVWECALHGETLPFFAAPDGFRSCRTCDDYSTIASQEE